MRLFYFTQKKRRAIGLMSGLFVFLWGIVLPCFAQNANNSVEFLANLNHRSSFLYNDCWGYTAPDGREYALLGVRNGTSIIDITDATNLREIAFIQSANSPWKDIKTYKNYAYAVTDVQGNGMQILDLSSLPDTVKLVNTYRDNGFLRSHNIYIDEPNAMLYAVGEIGETTRAISLADPVKPVQVSTFGSDCHDMYARNNIVYVAEASDGSFAIYDLQNAQSPKFLARLNIPSGGYAHNCWLSEDGNYLMTTEETFNRTVKYWDIRDLNDIKMVSEFLAPDRLAHNAHIKGNYAFISHYKDGLRVLDLTDPNNIQEVGFYDTFPGSSSSLFEGAWGAFPFFDSGKVLISDISTGLYLVKFTPLSTGIAESAGSPDAFVLKQNYPNPFNPSTVIAYELPQKADVQLSVFNLIGQEVRNLIDEQESAGKKSVTWDGKDASGRMVPAGVYYFKMTAKGNDIEFAEIKKGILIK